MAQKEFNQYYPRSGWVEHNPMEIYSSQYSVMMEAVTESGIAVEDIAAIGITNQRETTVVWDRNTGRPVYNAIVWQCRRTAAICDDLERRGLKNYITSAARWLTRSNWPKAAKSAVLWLKLTKSTWRKNS